MKVTMHISMNKVEGALVRLLGTMERRGHQILGISSGKSSLGESAQDLTVELDCGERSPGVLLRQLDRLHDVVEVQIDKDIDIPIIKPVWGIAHG